MCHRAPRFASALPCTHVAPGRHCLCAAQGGDALASVAAAAAAVQQLLHSRASGSCSSSFGRLLLWHLFANIILISQFKILDSGKTWWTAKNTSGKVGSVPSNYMQECEPPIGGDDSDSSGSDYEAFDPKDIHGGLPQGQADDYVNAEMWSTDTQRRGSSASSSSSRGRAASTGSRPRSQVGAGGKNKPVPIDEKLYDRDSSDDDSDYEDPDNVKPIVRGGGKITKTRTESVKVVPATKALPE